MNIVICDDNIEFTEELNSLLIEYFSNISKQLPDIQVYTDGQSLLDNTNGNIDIAFLDVEMPGINGITVGQELKNRDNKILIFITTSFSEYLDEAMKFHIFRYLSKPIDKQRLYRNLKDALALINSRSDKILIDTKTNNFTIFTNEIIMIEAIGHKVTIFTISNTYETINNMKYWEEKLTQKCFFRTHRSYIVNMDYISDFDHLCIHFNKYNLQAYLTRRKYTLFKTNYMLYLESLK